MRLRFLSADSAGRIDGVLHDRLWNHVSNFVNENFDVTIVGVSYFSDYKFNPELLKLRGKKWIICDTCEWYGQFPEFKTHLFTRAGDTKNFGGNEEWIKFAKFCQKNPPILSFVRELFKPDQSEIVVPIEWPTHLPEWEYEPKENFDTRPFEVFFNWGFSSCYRSNLHGDIYKNWCKEGYEVIGNFDHIDAKINEPQRKWITIHSPHSHRTDIHQIARRQAQSKISVGLMGAGVCCFRNTELVHSIPAIHSPDKVWSFPWRDGINSIHLKPGDEWNGLKEAVKIDYLHAIYLEARENQRNYQTLNYIQNWILPNISRVL